MQRLCLIHFSSDLLKFGLDVHKILLNEFSEYQRSESHSLLRGVGVNEFLPVLSTFIVRIIRSSV